MKSLFFALVLLGTAGDVDTIRQAEHQWLDAEYHGDTATLRRLLSPDYRTVSARGIHTRDQLIAGVLKRAAHPQPEPPYGEPSIVIHGSTALVTYGQPDTSAGVDVFAYENGHWHAIYSQHTEFEKASGAAR